MAAALAAGMFAALVVAWVTGSVPELRFRRRRHGQAAGRQQWLLQAGLDVTPRQFWVVSLGAGAAALAAVWLLSGVWSVALGPAVVVACLPRAYFARVRSRRLMEVQRAWPDGLRDLVASITSGMSLARAVEALAESGPAPLREAFGRYPLLSRTLGVVPALEIVKEELADATSDRVIEVLVLAHERGGAIVPEILKDLAEATTRDVWVLEEIQTQSLEQKINARVVFVLPWVVLVAMNVRSGPFRDFYQTTAGAVVVAIGGAMSLLGMWLIGRLGREPEEQRVLGGPVGGRVLLGPSIGGRANDG
ncbi:MAG: type II secretion system F family protein [Acidimicrobiia bacterium]